MWTIIVHMADLELESLVRKAPGIENFEFINEGFETLYTRPESLLVLKCCNFKKKKENKKVSPIKLKNMVEELRLFLYK